ncbi:MAG TPA: tetratricopeptide repeat protein [Gemmataceae bacterium]|jgi:tetratricopeptide (TPR) repeat protein
MRTKATKLCGAIVALSVLASLTVSRVHADDQDADLRKQALRLNEITGTEARLGEQEKLLKKENKPTTKKLLAEAARMAEEKPQPFNYNATLILGAVAIGVKDYRAAETFYRIHMDQAKKLRSAKGLMSAYRGLIASAYAKRKYAQTERLCAEATKNETILGALASLAGEKDKDPEVKELKSFVSTMLETQINAVALQGDADRAVKLIDDVLRDQSDGWLGLDLKARAFRFAGKNEDAIKAYEDEIQRLKEDNDLKKKEKEDQIDSVNYAESGVYIELDQVDKAVEKLKDLLAKHPDDPTYNNDLGYVWADHDMNLAESEKMVRKALEQDRKRRQEANPKLKPEEIKDTGAYLDSLGWVLYKQKKYVEAKRYLRQAVQNMVEEDENESIEIYDHLGDVLLALGQKAEAVEVWKKGVAAAGDTKREQKRKDEVQKKLKANE